jgi:hypothetical protein
MGCQMEKIPVPKLNFPPLPKQVRKPKNMYFVGKPKPKQE